MHRLIFLLLVIKLVFAWEDIIIPPLSVNKTGSHTVLIYIQGASIPTSSYVEIGLQIQAQVPFPLWVALPQMIDNVAAIPKGLSDGVDRIKRLLNKAGLPKGSFIFFGGHSLGGAMVVDYVNASSPDSDGLILHGAFINRKYKTGKTKFGRPQLNFPVPTLTVGAELDGLCRLTRISEALYSQIIFAEDPLDAERRFPVTVIASMNHGQFANSSNLSAFVTNNDITPEISTSQAVYEVAVDSAMFMLAVLGLTNWSSIDSRVAASSELVTPIINSLLMEGYWNFLPPCLCEAIDEYGAREYGTCISKPNCTGGCPWTSQFSQAIMGSGYEGLGINVTDSFHYVSEEHPSCHLPHIHGNSDPDANPGSERYPSICKTPINCELNISTVTEAFYKSSLISDTGFEPQTAFELRTKLKSRQAIYQAAGDITANITLTDMPISKGGIADICGEINQASLEWALTHIANSTLERYLRKGKPLKIGPDHSSPCIAGPCWIDAALKYSDHGTYVSIESIVMITQNFKEYPCGELSALPCDAGFHYCKLLSPARALEWMYIDSVKPENQMT